MRRPQDPPDDQNSRPVRHGEVEKIVNGGWGLLRHESGVVLVSYVIPGEKIAFRVKEKARGTTWGRLLEVIESSPQRIDPPCPYFGRCGGCAFQHIRYPFQNKIKKEILKDDLERIGKFQVDVDSIRVIESPPLHYRSRARFKTHPSGKIGFIEKGTDRVFPLDHCLLLPPEANRFLLEWNSQKNPPRFFQLDVLWNPQHPQIYVHLSHPPDRNQRRGLETFTLKGIQFSWKGNENPGISSLAIKNSYAYFISPAAFFQVNRFQWENMLNTVEAYCRPCRTAIDLYSGVGFFIPLLKKYAERVLAVESRSLSIQLAERAFPDAAFYRSPAEKFAFPPADLLLCDPPRSGLPPKVMEKILAQKYPDLVYISCSSATFSRDLKILLQNRYCLTDLTLIDLFPQTPHLEIVSLFTRVKRRDRVSRHNRGITRD